MTRIQMTTQILPLRPYSEFVDREGKLTLESYQFLLNLYLQVKLITDALVTDGTLPP